jgi:hypothetical protein
MGVGTCDQCPATTDNAKADGWAVVTIEIVRWIPDGPEPDDVRQEVQRIMELLCPDCSDEALRIVGEPNGGQQSTSGDQAATHQVREAVGAGKGDDRNG